MQQSACTANNGPSYEPAGVASGTAAGPDAVGSSAGCSAVGICADTGGASLPSASSAAQSTSALLLFFFFFLLLLPAACHSRHAGKSFDIKADPCLIISTSPSDLERARLQVGEWLTCEYHVVCMRICIRRRFGRLCWRLLFCSHVQRTERAVHVHQRLRQQQHNNDVQAVSSRRVGDLAVRCANSFAQPSGT